MAVKLNLLPSDYAVSKPVSNFLKFVKPLNIVLLSLFLVAALVMTGFFVIGSITLKNLVNENKNLKSQIDAQQQAQQQIVLLKDRLEKIIKVQTLSSSDKSFAALVPYLDNVGENSSIAEVDVDTEKIILSVNFKTNSELSNFFKSIDERSPFGGATLESFSYNPVSGYMVGFSFIKKENEKSS